MTRSALDYKPQHKKPDGWAGSTPRGPHRWARAAANALTNPRSAGAQLYRDRVANADWYNSRYENSMFEFRRDGKRQYAVCSVYCAVMQIQLEQATTERFEIAEVFDNSFERERTWTGRNVTTGEEYVRTWTQTQSHLVNPITRADLRRKTFCQCCGTPMKPSSR
jgi:hypothetical protein